MKKNEIQLLEANEIISASTEQLKQEFAKSLKVTADRLAYMATIYSELMGRGVDMSGLKGGLMEYMPLIASNQLDARLVIEYAGNKTLLSYLAKLSKDKQLELIERPVVKVVSLDDDVKSVEDINLDDIRAGQIFQVFDSNAGIIRDEEEQYKQLLVKNSNSKTRKSKNRRVNKVKIEGDSIVVKGMDISIKAVLQALSERDGIDYFSYQQK
ncbi:hypothetical protein [Psychrobacter sp. PG1]|uniref:hypothetical protein n=1 Tax=unclassified Psychrobacter TaxID=196806 RepID=UPI001866BCCB|nr:hypothetical protein [Psychrobacter sp. PG1]MDN5652284.1 hypothetical protein [Lactococcus lactis]